MTSIEELDEFVDWDRAADSLDKSGRASGQGPVPFPETSAPTLTQNQAFTPSSALPPGLEPTSLDPQLLHQQQQQPNFQKPQLPLEDPLSTMPTEADIDLVLSNVDDDDFSFLALQHFSSQDQASQNLAFETFPTSAPAAGPEPAVDPTLNSIQEFPGPDPAAVAQGSIQELWWFTPQKPCMNCRLGGYSCKKISEGLHKGYCTSCVALACDCSFVTQPVSENHSRSSSLSINANLWSPNTQTTPASTSGPSVGLLSASFSETAPAITAASSSDSIAALAKPSDSAAPNKNSPPPKIGARFSRESVKILKNWLATHNRHPYPSDEEKEMLQRQTGLNKTQITNWLANARRRGKVQAPRSTSPHVGNTWTGPAAIDIPRRPGTPALDSNMRSLNPLERWVDSPPENEAASVSAIARAVASNSEISSGLNSPYSFAFTDDGSGRSQCNASSASSLGTSSNGSWASAFSHASRGSLGSFGSGNQRGRRRRRKRAAPKRPDEKTSLSAPLKTFQCTFCTETFRTKHDWQRHEKSLHLSLERWVCAPQGPRVLNPTTNQVSCVYCGQVDPDDAHIESHNHSACQERAPSERTFYRKDHLNQHLKLVHNVKFLDWGMKSWKVASPSIRSRCGFCGIVMDSWSIRIDHLAEHFKTGNTMADWKGDWGFDAPVLDMVENSIPPYLIDNERNSPFPYIASGAPAESPRSAYELIKMELAYFMTNLHDKTRALPTDEEMKLEACRIIFASEVLSLQGISSNFSWLRDLMMSSGEIARQAQFGPMRSQIENRLSLLKINGKDNLFEQCPLENQLQEFVRAKRLLGLTAMDDELQEEACRIVGRIEEISTTPSDFIANWLVRQVQSSTNWLANFRQRAHLPRTEDIACVDVRPTDQMKIDSTIYNYSRMERALGEYMDEQRALGIEPSNEDLQRVARITIYEFDDGWNQTAADNVEWLESFRLRHARGKKESSPANTTSVSNEASSARGTAVTFDTSTFGTASDDQCHMDDDYYRAQLEMAAQLRTPTSVSSSVAWTRRHYLLNDANCYRRLARELSRFVASSMSPNNPNQHTPTDEELQHHARWIIYNEDDPWNQTAADNVEWLERFKRDVGITSTAGPGLEMDASQWSLAQGGTGFAPPYAFPNPNNTNAMPTPEGFTGGYCSGSQERSATGSAARSPDQQRSAGSPSSGRIEVPIREDGRLWEMDPATLNKFFETLPTRYQKPGTVFCSRELEAGLVTFVGEEVRSGAGFPTDEALREKGRSILGRAQTAADDNLLLGRFKSFVMGQLGAQGERLGGDGASLLGGLTGSQAMGSGNTDAFGFPPGSNMGLTDEQMDSLMEDMNFDVEQGGAPLGCSSGLGGSCDMSKMT